MKKPMLLIAMLAFALAGCGETVVDDVKTEGAIKQNVESELDLKVASVDCPSDVEVEAGTTFKCTVAIAGGKEQTATLKVLNDDADIEFIKLGASKPDKQ